MASNIPVWKIKAQQKGRNKDKDPRNWDKDEEEDYYK